MIDDRLAEISKLYPFPVSELDRLKNRRWILEEIPKKKSGTIGAEIGVFRGHYSEVICEIVKPRKFYLIDGWTLCGETFGWGKEAYTNMDQLPTAVAKEESSLRCARFKDVETVVLEARFPGCKDLISEPLDWAYLDAGHQFDDTLDQLHGLNEIITPNGIILGDDFCPDPLNKHHGVFRAVHAFVQSTDWCIIAAGLAGQWAVKRCN